MNFNSIITKINFVFAFTLILLIAVFFAYLEYENKQFMENKIEEYKKISNHIHQNRLSPNDIEKFVEKFYFEVVNNPEQIRGNSRPIIQGEGFDIQEYQDQYYFHFHTPFFDLMFKDLNSYNESYIKYYVFVFILLLLLSIYILIIKNIKQTTLHLESRQLFLRTVMHELKTPIAKGRIVSELIDNEKQKVRMIQIFKKLNFLINDFAKVEEIVSNNYTTNMNKVNMEIIIAEAIELLMIDNYKDKIILENINTQKIVVDLSLLSMAIKNLIDNGLKYSIDKRIIIRQEQNSLLFITKGEKLSKPIDDYYKPFHNETKSKNHGMGLGIYIVKSILDMHKFDFKYIYKNESNIFKIIF